MVTEKENVFQEISDSGEKESPEVKLLPGDNDRMVSRREAEISDTKVQELPENSGETANSNPQSEDATMGALITRSERRPQQDHFLGDSFKVSPRGIEIIGDPGEEEYDTAFQRVKEIVGNCQWWYGDLANGYESRYGEIKLLAAKIGIDYGTLRNCKSIARQYPMSSRHDKLCFKHHQITASQESREELLRLSETNHWSTAQLIEEIKKRQFSVTKEPAAVPGFAPPRITSQSIKLWLAQQPLCDLLITSPPRWIEENVDNIPNYRVSQCIYDVLSKVKPTGRAYIFVDPEPEHCLDIQLTQNLIWKYGNSQKVKTNGVQDYLTNYQLILYYCGPEAPPLNSQEQRSRLAVLEYDCPDPQDLREKPEELLKLLIQQSTQLGDLVLDPFAGKGGGLLTAARLGRTALGRETDPELVEMAVERGCQQITESFNNLLGR